MAKGSGATRSTSPKGESAKSATIDLSSKKGRKFISDGKIYVVKSSVIQEEVNGDSRYTRMYPFSDPETQKLLEGAEWVSKGAKPVVTETAKETAPKVSVPTKSVRMTAAVIKSTESNIQSRLERSSNSYLRDASVSLKKVAGGAELTVYVEQKGYGDNLPQTGGHYKVTSTGSLKEHDVEHSKDYNYYEPDMRRVASTINKWASEKGVKVKEIHWHYSEE